ncbi:phenylcoumaran benzylic ether reductase [Microdochium nivale]|nr:phenylcoumaran benzylic ether reductase [Microdochium nivale]
MIELAGELALVEAARRTKVGRFVPSFWAIVCPPRGIVSMRAAKEDVLDAIKRAHLPYTAIDIGWWYQWCLPRLPSGKLDAVLTYPDTEIVGTGEVRSALTDIDDIGKYVARIITDPRTLNKLVFAYGEVKTQREVWDMVEALAGDEKIPRPVLSAEDVERIISSANEALAKDQSNMAALVEKGWTEYKLSRGIRADNTPEYAKYLGYLDVKELYPEIEARTIKDYISEVLVGKSNAVLYAGQEDHALKLLKAPK